MSRRRPLCCVLGFALALLLGPACRPRSSPAIADAHALADGVAVTLEGYANVAPGTFASSTGDPGFSIQAGGRGIYVSSPAQVEVPVGARVEVSGTLATHHGLRVIEATLEGIRVVPGPQAPAALEPVERATGALGEAELGRLVRVRARVVQAPVDDRPYGTKLFVDDGSGELQIFVHFVDGAELIDTRALRPGSSVELVGVALRYDETYELCPRGPEDLF